MFDHGTRQLIEQTLLVFAALFPIVNPVGGAPVFLAMTRGLEDAQRRLLARRIALNAFLLVMGSIFIGNYVIEFFGLSVPVIQVGGGLLVCALAWRLLHSDETADQIRIGPRSIEEMAARAFYPMTLPLTVGSRLDLGGDHAWRASPARRHRVGDQHHGIRARRVPARAHDLSAVSVCRATDACARRHRHAGAVCACPPSSCCASACRSSGAACSR